MPLIRKMMEPLAAVSKKEEREDGRRTPGRNARLLVDNRVASTVAADDVVVRPVVGVTPRRCVIAAAERTLLARMAVRPSIPVHVFHGVTEFWRAATWQSPRGSL